MEKIEVLKKATSTDEAFSVLSTLPQPICIVVFKGTYDYIKEYMYKEIAEKINSKIPVIIRGSTSWAAKDMLSKGKNVILTISDAIPGNLHKTISGLRAVVDNKEGSIVGICVKSALSSADPVISHSVSLHAPISDCLNCLITIYL